MSSSPCQWIPMLTVIASVDSNPSDLPSLSLATTTNDLLAVLSSTRLVQYIVPVSAFMIKSLASSPLSEYCIFPCFPASLSVAWNPKPSYCLKKKCLHYACNRYFVIIILCHFCVHSSSLFHVHILYFHT